MLPRNNEFKEDDSTIRQGWYRDPILQAWLPYEDFGRSKKKVGNQHEVGQLIRQRVMMIILGHQRGYLSTGYFLKATMSGIVVIKIMGLPKPNSIKSWQKP